MELSYSKLRELTVGLSLCKGVGPSMFYKLLTQFNDINGLFNGIENIYALSLKFNQSSLLESYHELNLPSKVSYVCCWEDNYPLNLKSAQDRPIVLYYQGNYDISKLNNSISIVETRKPTDYGVKNTKQFTES